MAALAALAAAEARGGAWDSILDMMKVAQEKGCDPLLWAVQLTSSLNRAGVSLPSPEFADVLVSYICWDNNVPILWKFLDRALAVKIAPPLLVIALLSTRVVPVRQSRPAAYRLYMELLKRHAFALKSQIDGSNYHKVTESIDTVLHLSEKFSLAERDAGTIVVEFIFSIVWQLLDASLDDEGILELTPEKSSMWGVKPQDMEIDSFEGFEEKWTEGQGRLQSANTTMAIELIGLFLQDKVTSRILYLARRNLPTQWAAFTQRLKVLGTNSAALRNSKIVSHDAFQQLTSDARIVLSREMKTSSHQKFHAVMAFGALSSANFSDVWLPLDIVLEDSMDAYQVNAASAIEIITGLVKTLQAINGTTWHDTFLSLWISALRLVQRERDPIEGPMPRLDTRLCMLLSITPLVIANLIEEEETALSEAADCGSPNPMRENTGEGNRRNDLMSSLQMLGDFQGLLTPPRSIVSAANQAAAKAMLFLSGINVGSSYFECVNVKDMPLNCSGNMRHLIVEACIARNLLDTSAYFWPGYVNGHINQMPPNFPTQVPSWSSFMKGAPLTPALINALVSSPASSLAELEKVFEIAVKGSEEEKISAATILCGASLLQGWSVQEHTVDFITRLLSPPKPADYTGDDSYLIAHAPMLNVLIVGIGSVDCVQVFSLHGLKIRLQRALQKLESLSSKANSNASVTVADSIPVNYDDGFLKYCNLLCSVPIH
ncbi:hypothetical protein CDL15_Pgr008505 [Punica granatum]|uniref:Mediator of RNA polymerase II transcription subunit 33A-like n=1 Tax=Punica granatum TaxID=22663 RepID=A0A218WQC7_PUNGR|nr:hypothetical protein CDL15_Pgr008505 [Punica granatum]